MDISGLESILEDINREQRQQQGDLGKNSYQEKNKNVIKKIDIQQLQNEIFEPIYSKKNTTLQKNKNDIHSGHRQRARERFLNNPSAISDYDLLELLLFLIIPRADTKPIAKKLIDKYKTLKNLFNADTNQLNNDGINGSALKYIFLLLQTTQERLLLQEMSEQQVIDDYEVLIKYCQTSIGAMKEEQFRILFLDSKFKLLSDVVFANGEISSANISCREIVKKSIELRAENIVMYHNHPNEDLTPSNEDIDTTKIICDIVKTINVKTIDHIIVSGNKYFSFKEEGLL